MTAHDATETQRAQRVSEATTLKSMLEARLAALLETPFSAVAVLCVLRASVASFP